MFTKINVENEIVRLHEEQDARFKASGMRFYEFLALLEEQATTRLIRALDEVYSCLIAMEFAKNR